jgi:hypothetical protein
MESYQFKYKAKTYECVGEDRDFQIEQFNFLLESRDYTTLKNRIINQTGAWDCLIEVPNPDCVLTERMTKEDVEIVKKEIKKTKFW